MTLQYHLLSAEERAAIMLMHANHSLRDIARHLDRSVSTVSHEIARHTITAEKGYDASLAGFRAHITRRRARRTPKLHPDSQLFGLVTYLLCKYWSPRQIALTLKRMYPHDPKRHVSHETIYNALYVMPRGSLKKELITCLRQGHGKRRPRSRDETVPPLDQRSSGANEPHHQRSDGSSLPLHLVRPASIPPERLSMGL
ncbi:IS30 family transposase [Vreelandella nanhaiensis]|uniref:IS30 family transposase n=1 Tax=Vreelandella nanhaiensis TaxID=1258546 RepID=A0A433KSX2_9GAMM|nr:IS30 family transposase [Halomonas nanhaiensis]